MSTGLPPVSYAHCKQVAGAAPAGYLQSVHAFKHGSGRFIRADVYFMPGLIVRGVLASPTGVVWPTRYGEALIDFEDAELQQRVEQALRAAALKANQKEAA